MEARRELKDKHKILGKKKKNAVNQELHMHQIYPSKMMIYLRHSQVNKTRKFIANRPRVQERVKEVFSG